ncbi:MAG: DUF1549 and DUF1553 domain-containing protein [Verrucomicrobiota bacterium]
MQKLGFILFALSWTTLASAEQADPRRHWSFQPLAAPELPTTEDANWSRTNIDQFLLRRLEEAGLKPNPDADPHTLLRRVFFTVIGLPPTPEEIRTWAPRLAENPDETLPKLLDDLLARPAFGQRWGKHWLDVARFAESAGQSRNISYRFAWAYRNWVIDAFNADMPFDRFVHEQLAGDLLPAATREESERQHAGTGFLLVGPKLLNENNTSLVYRMGVVDDQIDTTFRAFMGLTVGCARCHEHFFDPITTRDYYALAGIFRSTKNLAGVKSNNNTIDNGLFPLGEDGQEIIDEIARAEAYLLEVTPIFTKARRAQMGLENDIKDAKARSAAAEELAELEQALEEAKVVHKEKLKIFQDARKAIPEPPPSVMAVKEGDLVADCEIFNAGDVGQPGEIVPRGTIGFLADRAPLETIATNESGRMQLANWITDSQNPLTARIIVNRVWGHVFGVGLVDTPDNFGGLGAEPSHPELLDHLAIQFVERGWSVKDLIKTLMLSRAFHLSSEHSSAAYAIDADVRLRWRMNPRRLEAEAIRDSLLFVAGNLDLAQVNSSAVSELGMFEGKVDMLDQLRASHDHGNYRSVYLPVMRAALPDMMKDFDAADPSTVSGARKTSTVAPQALFLMNNPWVIEQTQVVAQQLQEIEEQSKKIDAVYLRILGRTPTESERKFVQEFVTNQGDEIWAEVCHSLIASGEFRTIY